MAMIQNYVKIMFSTRTYILLIYEHHVVVCIAHVISVNVTQRERGYFDTKT